MDGHSYTANKNEDRLTTCKNMKAVNIVAQYIVDSSQKLSRNQAKNTGLLT